MKTVRSILQHYGNGLHVYCRLCSFLPCKTARKCAKWYERRVQWVVYAI